MMKGINQGGHMNYWVYENFVHDKAIIHSADCSFCNGGKGLTNMNDAARTRDKWHGPFKDLESAEVCAKNTSRENIKSCNFCTK